MFVFLPPSEGKTVPQTTAEARLELSELILPELEHQRQQVIEALAEASGRDDAQQVLKVGAKAMAEVPANMQLLSAAAAPAYQVYSGVLFDALGTDSMTTADRQRAAEQVLIFSGLFGVTSFTDDIPAYRLAMDVNLSPFGDQRDPGRLANFWRTALRAQLSELIGEQLILDCRSSSYAAAFRPPAQQTLMVNSLTEKDGQRRVVSHFAKQARGRLAGMVLRRQRLPASIEEVADIAAQHWKVEVRPAEGTTPHQLDLIAAAE